MLPVTEAQFQASVIEWAERSGWFVFAIPDWAKNKIMVSIRDHPRVGKRALPKGWPDLVLLRPSASGAARLVVAELKTDKGKVAPAQVAVLDLFRGVEGVEVCVWRPGDWDAIEGVLG